MDIGSKIKEIRINKNITRDELAKLIHKSPSMLKAYENGYSDINVTTLIDISHALKVSVTALVSEEQDILSIIKDFYNLNDNAKYCFEDDFRLLISALKDRYK